MEFRMRGAALARGKQRERIRLPAVLHADGCMRNPRGGSSPLVQQLLRARIVTGDRGSGRGTAKGAALQEMVLSGERHPLRAHRWTDHVLRSVEQENKPSRCLGHEIRSPRNPVSAQQLQRTDVAKVHPDKVHEMVFYYRRYPPLPELGKPCSSALLYPQVHDFVRAVALELSSQPQSSYRGTSLFETDMLYPAHTGKLTTLDPRPSTFSR